MRTFLIIALVLIALPIVALIGWQMMQASEERKRPALLVSGLITDSAGVPLPSITLRFDDQTRRHVTPIPFVGPDRWLYAERSVTSGPDGRFSTTFKGNAFRLTGVESNGQSRSFASRRDAARAGRMDTLTNQGAWFIQDPLSYRTNALVIVTQ